MKNMKLFYGILVGLMIFSSCSSDDDNDNSNTTSSSLVGTWKQINEVDYCSSGTQTTIDTNACEQNSRYTFHSDGTYSTSIYELNGSDCTLTYTETGHWEISNNSLIINTSPENFEFTTFETTGNTLKIGRESIDEGEPCNDGHIISYELNFVRVE